MRAHGALTEDSRTYRVVTHDRKGREGNGKWKTVAGLPSMTSGSSPSRPGFEVDRSPLVAGLMDGGFAEMRGAW